jgi:hypothetical protein
MAKLHPKMIARAAAVKAAHAHLSKTVPGFRKLAGRDQIARTHAHVSRGGAMPGAKGDGC